jgi:hypothetical protein
VRTGNPLTRVGRVKLQMPVTVAATAFSQLAVHGMTFHSFLRRLGAIPFKRPQFQEDLHVNPRARRLGARLDALRRTGVAAAPHKAGNSSKVLR